VTLCTAVLPATSCQTSMTLPPGFYGVTATYSGDADRTGTTASGASFTLTQAETSMTESASPASINIGSADTLSVSGLPGDATGIVTFSAGGATLCVATLPGLNCPTAPSLGLGAYDVTATYSGDADYDVTTATGASFTVVLLATSITETAAPASVPYGTADTLSVAGLPTGATGTLTFATATLTLCVATLPAVSCVTSAALDIDAYDVTATYSGDTDNTGAVATGATFAVVRAATAMTVSVSPGQIAAGAAITASVSGLPTTATGTVTFTIGDLVLCTATLPATSCTGTLALDPGTYDVRATYSGDDHFTGSTVMGSGVQGTFLVLGATTTTTGTTTPDTGSGLLEWRFALGAMLVLAGVAVSAWATARSRKRPSV
jgi:Big-like domain-containing protein